MRTRRLLGVADAIQMNEVFLRSHGSSWCDPTLRLQYGETHVEVGSAQSFISEIQQFLESSWVDKPLVVKDPRIASLAKFWIEAAKRSEFEIKVIIPNRHPYEVAASLATRDGASADLSDVLWLKANFLAERASRALPRIFVNYADLLSDWRTQVKRIEAALDSILAPTMIRSMPFSIRTASAPGNPTAAAGANVAVGSSRL